MNAGAGTVYSARSYVLAWILIPVVLIIAVDTFALYRNALRSVGAAYDRTLLATAHAVGDAVRYEKGRFRVSLPLALFVARRPGRVSYLIHLEDGRLLQSLAAQPNRHFYGHGVFHASGDWLYATENDTSDPGRGLLGVYRFVGGC